MIRFSSTLSSRSLVRAWGMTPIARRTSSASRDHVEAVDEGGARGRGQEGGEHADQGRLAGAVRSQEAEDLALLHGEAHAVHGGEVAERLDDAPDVDGGHAR